MKAIIPQGKEKTRATQFWKPVSRWMCGDGSSLRKSLLSGYRRQPERYPVCAQNIPQGAGATSRGSMEVGRKVRLKH